MVLYPALAWLLVVGVSGAPKGQTNAEVELLALAVVVAFAVYARVGAERVKASRHRALLLPVVALVSCVLLAVAVPPFRHYDQLGAWLYVRTHHELSPATRGAIVRGVVTEGMSDEEAAAAGGPASWVTLNGVLKRLSFNNLSQFGTKQPVAFVAHFEDGRVGEIETLDDLSLCKSTPATPDAGQSFEGFWKKDCALDFGWRFSSGAQGRYGVRFCGPGGCGEIDACTSIPSRRFAVIDGDTLLDRGPPSATMKRCAR